MYIIDILRTSRQIIIIFRDDFFVFFGVFRMRVFQLYTRITSNEIAFFLLYLETLNNNNKKRLAPGNIISYIYETRHDTASDNE